MGGGGLLMMGKNRLLLQDLFALAPGAIADICAVPVCSQLTEVKAYKRN
jgi:hypothetical protein